MFPYSGDAVEEVGVEPAELGPLARGLSIDDGVQVLLEVGGAGPERRLKLPPGPGVDEVPDADQVPRVGPHHGLGLLARLLRHGQPEVERAGAARRGRQQMGRHERRADNREPSASAGDDWFLRLLMAIARARRLGWFVGSGGEACGECLDGELQ